MDSTFKIIPFKADHAVVWKKYCPKEYFDARYFLLSFIINSLYKQILYQLPNCHYQCVFQ